jgi:hypothetical protein
LFGLSGIHIEADRPEVKATFEMVPGQSTDKNSRNN